MRKQGEFYLKLISIVLAVVIAAYVLFSVLLNSGSGYALETVAYCEVGDGVTVSGFVVRSEEVLVGASPVVVYERAEGERVASGERVATGYASGDARDYRQELASLQSQRDQLSYAAEGSDSSNAATLDGEISTLLVELSAQTAQRRLSAMRLTAAELTPLVLRRSVSGSEVAQVKNRILQIDARISELSAQTATGATAITVAHSGYFSETVDGYETSLTPQALESMTPSALRALRDRANAPAVPKDAIGRLIDGQKWYYVAEIPAERAAECEAGSRLSVSFADNELQELSMRVERVSEPEDGACVLVLSCEELLHKVTALRRQTADVVFRRYEGLRVPKSAIYYVDGETGVYVLEGARAEWKEIELLYENGEDYLVVWDSSDTDNLWPKDELILTSDEIQDGMVMIH